MPTGVIMGTIFVLTLVRADSTMIKGFCYKFATGLTLLLSIVDHGHVFRQDANNNWDGTADGVQDSGLGSVQPTLEMKGLLLILFGFSVGLLGSRTFQVHGIEHLWGPKQFGEHIY